MYTRSYADNNGKAHRKGDNTRLRRRKEPHQITTESSFLAMRREKLEVEGRNKGEYSCYCQSLFAHKGKNLDKIHVSVGFDRSNADKPLTTGANSSNASPV